jgi:hypothetical protein
MSECSAPGFAVLSFHRDGNIAATGQGHAVEVFAAARRFAEDFHAVSPSTGIIFSADLSEPSRVKLYQRLAILYSRRWKVSLATEDDERERFFILGDDAGPVVDQISSNRFQVFSD